jgi:predicted component of type VI protein secretion system
MTVYTLMFFLQGNVKALALRTLREILRNQGERFRDYAELTILRVLEAHQDPAKSVSIVDNFVGSLQNIKI